MGDVYMVNGKILSGLPNHAKDIVFDNTGTDLISTNSEDAIKEVNSNLSTMLIQAVTAPNVNMPNRTAISGNPLNLPLPTSDRAVLNIYDSHNATFGQAIIETNGTTVSSIDIGSGDYVYISGIIK